MQCPWLLVNVMKPFFQIAVGDIGPLFKLRVSRHQEGDTWSKGGWHIIGLDLKDKDKDKTPRKLPLDRWLDRDKEDMDVSREVAIPRKDKETLMSKRFHIYVLVVYWLNTQSRR